jgi:tRNA uridine 5-carbamoylmethylation protein Kti12
MICFFSGYPFSGKSFVIEELKKALLEEIIRTSEDLLVVDPKKYRPDEYDTLSEEDKREVNISAWECSLEELKEVIEDNPNEHVIIFDTSCASYKRMSEYFTFAKSCKHQVVYVFVNARVETCERRAGNKWMGEVVIQKYKDSFKENIVKFKATADKTIVINNNADVAPDIRKLVAMVAHKV